MNDTRSLQDKCVYTSNAEIEQLRGTFSKLDT